MLSTDPKTRSGFNLYSFIRPLLFRLDPEKAHHLTLALLKTGVMPKWPNDQEPTLHTVVSGLPFSNPVGLAAGFDKQAEAMGALLGLGFGFVEVGSITPLPQPGNPKPRLFRLPEADAVINRFGFNSDGFDLCLRRLVGYRDNKRSGREGLHKGLHKGLVGVNIGKNKESVDAVADYVLGVETFASCADYLTVNVSSPNTVGLRDLQTRGPLEALLKRVMTARDAAPNKPPLFVKIAPDVTESQQHDIAEAVIISGADGIIIGNTTVSRPGRVSSGLANESGGLSGRPLFELSTEVLTSMYKITKGQIPLIGCGGVASGEDAYKKIRSGASLVQLYTALIYGGPLLVRVVNHELARLLKRDGFRSVSEAVGAGL